MKHLHQERQGRSRRLGSISSTRPIALWKWIPLALLAPAILAAQGIAQGPPPPRGGGGGGDPATPYLGETRTIDGSRNNVRNPWWGQAVTPFARLVPSDYGDGRETPAGSHRVSAREISNAIFAQSEKIENSAGASDFVWQWGQFLDHDLDLTPEVDPIEPFDIEVPAFDPWFDPTGEGDVLIPLDRSHYEIRSGVRQQTNEITAYIDGSNVYGSDEARAMELRELDGTGRLRTSEGDLLPYNTNGFPNAPDANDSSFFLAGDFRANEQVGLTAMHTLFVREHNYWSERIARKLDAAGELPPIDGPPHETRRRDEHIYQLARAIVAGEMQVITYAEFLPLLLGPDALPRYRGYDRRENATIANAFATAAYRFGHSMLSPSLLRLDGNGDPTPEGSLPLAEAFFRPDILAAEGIEPLLRGLAHQTAQEIDAKVDDAVRNFLFGPPGAGGFDLVSLNIQRGRDHGLPGYNRAREAFGLAAALEFADICSDADVQAQLASVYATPDDVDLWVGGLAEDPVEGALLGETFSQILRRQFVALRDGDRFWYARHLPPQGVRVVERQTLADILRRNTNIGDEVQDDVFRVE